MQGENEAEGRRGSLRGLALSLIDGVVYSTKQKRQVREPVSFVLWSIGTILMVNENYK